MTRSEIFDVLKTHIRTVVESVGDRPVEILETHNMADDLGADSLETVEVMSRVVKQLRLRVPRTELADADTLGEVLDILERAAASESVEG